jgi:hypothetical protein
MRLFLLLLPVVALAQLAPNSVTVTASRNTIVPSDLIVFNVSLSASPDAGFDEVLAAASGAGLTVTNFRNVTLSNGGPASLLFTTTAPLNDTKATVGLLNAMQQSLAREKKFTLSFQVGGTDVSAQALAAQKCPLADLVAEARTKAASLASADGVNVGAIQSLTSSTAQCSLTATFGQGSPRFIAIAAQTPPSNAAPTRLTITLNASADQSVGLDRIVQAVAPAGVSAADLSYVTPAGSLCKVIGGGCETKPSPVQWAFVYSAPLSKWKDTIAALARARDANHPGITVDYQVSAEPPAPSECAQPTLISQARRMAQDVATAAGVAVGPLTAVSDQAPVQGGITLAKIGIFDPFVPTRVFAPPGCSTVAQFSILP